MFGKLFVVCLVVAGSRFGVLGEGPAGMVLYFKSGEEVSCFSRITGKRSHDP